MQKNIWKEKGRKKKNYDIYYLYQTMQKGMSRGVRRKYIIKGVIILGIILGAITLLPVCRVEAKESGNMKIHFISLNSSTDAILL